MNHIEAPHHDLNQRVRAVVERDHAARRRRGFDSSVRVSHVRPWSLKERPA